MMKQWHGKEDEQTRSSTNNDAANEIALPAGFTLQVRREGFKLYKAQTFCWNRAAPGLVPFLRAMFDWNSHFQLSPVVQVEWEITGFILQRLVGLRNMALKVHAFQRDDTKPAGMLDIDVGANVKDRLQFITCGIPRHVTPQDVEGLHWDVLAYMASQAEVAIALREMVIRVEAAAVVVHEDSVIDVAYACDGGTHRSVACATLTNLIPYPDAILCFHTPRVNRAAARSVAFDRNQIWLIEV